MEKKLFYILLILLITNSFHSSHWNTTEQLAFLAVQQTDLQGKIYKDAINQVLSSWTFSQVPSLFLQQDQISPEKNQTQLPHFGAKLPWQTIFEILEKSDPTSTKLIFFIRHAQAWENLCPDNEHMCTFEYDGEKRQNFDSGLSYLGVKQAKNLNLLLQSPSQEDSGSWFKLLRLGNAAYFTSPNMRTLETSLDVFANISFMRGGNNKVPVSISVVASELLRSGIGKDVCNFRRTVSDPLHVLPMPAPFITHCNTTGIPGLQQMFGGGGKWGVSFSFPVRPPGGNGFGLISDGDILWRSDIDETDEQGIVRSVAFLSQLFALESSSVVVVVTHGEMIDFFSLATGGKGYSAANTEVVPMMIKMKQQN